MANKENPPEKIEVEKPEQLGFEVASPISAEELIGPLAANMPEPTGANVTQGDVAQAAQSPVTQESPPVVQSTAPEIRDKFGAVFDPQLHRANLDGTPKFGVNGQFLKKYKAGLQSPPSEDGNFSTVRTASAGTGVDAYENAAEMTLQTAYGISSAFLSDDIRPENNAEHQMLKVPLAAVFREKGTVAMTPTQALLLAVAAYIGKKAAKPTVRERFLLLYIKVRGFFGEKTPTPKKEIETA